MQFAPPFYVDIRLKKRDYLLTPRSNILLGNLIVAQLVKKITVFYGSKKVNRPCLPDDIALPTNPVQFRASCLIFLSYNGGEVG